MKRQNAQKSYRKLGWLPGITALVLLLATELAQAAAPAGVWWDANYTYRRQITLPAGVAALPLGYAVAFTFKHLTEVGAARSLASGDDVRVVYWNGSTWVELDRIADPDNTWNLDTTVIWFKTQAALAANATDTNYYLYYGYSAATAPPATTMPNIFSFYDDFSAAAVDTATRWTNSGATQSGGVLTVGNGAQIRSQATFGTATIWETRAKLSSASAPAGTFSFWAANSSNNYNFASPYLRFYSSTIANHTTEDSVAATTTQTFAPTSPTSYQAYAIARDSATSVRFLVNGTAVTTFAHASSNTALKILLTNATAAGQTQQYTWARVRPYRNPDPTLSLAAGATQIEPIGEWRLDQKAWTGAAGEVLDSSTNGLNMSSFGSATTAIATPAKTGNPGTCRYANLNGTTQYAQVADNALLDLTDQVTVSVWVYPRSWPAAGGLKSIVSKDDNFEFHLDPNGRVYYWWNGGAPREITSTASVPLNQWTHIAITYKSGAQYVYINGVQRGSNTQTGALPVNALPLQIGQDQGIADRFWNGYIDEVRVYGTALTSAQVNTVMNETHPCVPEADHFSVTHDGYGINCLPEQITVNLLDVSNGAVLGFTQPVTISTGTTTGTWSLISGAGSLSATTNGAAIYQWASTESSVVFGLSYQQSGPITPTAASTSVNTGTAPNLVFNPSGFTVTSSALSNPPPGAIPAFASPQIAGTNFTTYITAYGTTATDTQCGVIEAYTGAKTLRFWSTYINPNTGTRSVAINASNIATTEGASALQAVTFTNGQASVTTLYKDAGSINISMKDDTTGNPSLATGIRGSSGNFVVKPATFVLSNIRRTSDLFANPAASNAAGTVFIAAGQTFSATVTAYDSGATGPVTATPNFGKESPAESVALTSALVLPVGGQNPAVVAASGLGLFTNGVASGTDFTWSEVGIITLTPHIKDSDYLGAGDVLGTTSGNVGRFIPSSFAVSPNVPTFQTACATGGFTYLGQPFNYATVPVLSVTARAASGSTTRNYTDVFFKLTNASLTGRTYTPVSGTLDITGLPATDPTIQDLTNGLGSLRFSSGTGISFTRTTPIAPLTAQVSLSINVVDSDGVAATNPIAFNNIAFTNTGEQRYGRIAFRNAVGSELLDLPVPMRSEYFANAASGFVVSSADTCTTGVSLTLGNFGGNLTSGETCVVDNGSPGVSGAGCAAAGVIGQRFSMPPTAGDFIAILRAPGAGNDGTVTISTVVPSWLRFDWNTSVSGQENPSGKATFGLFKGDAKRIFQTEK